MTAMFGMGFGELVLILIIVVMVFGATRLSPLGDPIQVSPSRRDKTWSLYEWTLVVAMAGMAALLVASLVTSPRGR